MQCRRPRFDSWVGKIPWRRDRLPTPVVLGFPGCSAGKEPACNAGDLGSIPESGRSPGEGNSNPLQYSGLENSTDCIAHGVSESAQHIRQCALCSIAKSCPTLCDPRDCSPSASPVHDDSPGKNTGGGSHSLFHGIVPIQG